jgi:hypothetical protein
LTRIQARSILTTNSGYLFAANLSKPQAQNGE